MTSWALPMAPVVLVVGVGAGPAVGADEEVVLDVPSVPSRRTATDFPSCVEEHGRSTRSTASSGAWRSRLPPRRAAHRGEAQHTAERAQQALCPTATAGRRGDTEEVTASPARRPQEGHVAPPGRRWTTSAAADVAACPSPHSTTSSPPATEVDGDPLEGLGRRLDPDVTPQRAERAAVVASQRVGLVLPVAAADGEVPEEGGEQCVAADRPVGARHRRHGEVGRLGAAMPRSGRCRRPPR